MRDDEIYQWELKRLKVEVDLRERLLELSNHPHWLWLIWIAAVFLAWTLVILSYLAWHVASGWGNGEDRVQLEVTHRIEAAGNGAVDPEAVKAVAGITSSILDLLAEGAEAGTEAGSFLRSVAEDFASSYTDRMGSTLADETWRALSSLLAEAGPSRGRGSEPALGVLYFNVNSALLPRSATMKLAAICKLSIEHGFPGLAFMGHADRSGGENWNVDLSTRRATAARNWFHDSCPGYKGQTRSLGMGEGTSGAQHEDNESDPEERKVLVRAFEI